MRRVSALLLLAPGAARAATWHVEPAGFGDFTSVQDAIDAAAPGDVVRVLPGRYAETLDFGGKDVWVESTDGPDVTVIEADADAVVTFSGGETPAAGLGGFTVRSATGVALRVDGGSPTLEALVVEADAGGLVVAGGGAPELLDVTLRGAGVHVLVEDGWPVLSGVDSLFGGRGEEGAIRVESGGIEITEGRIVGGGLGGGVWIGPEVVASLTDTVFWENVGASGALSAEALARVTLVGGLISDSYRSGAYEGSAVTLAEGADLYAQDVELRDNAVGGAVRVWEGATAWFDRCDFHGNKGALSAYGDVTLRDSDLWANESEYNGGAIVMTDADLTIERGRFDGNLGGSRLGGAVASWRGDVTIRDTVFYGNEADNAGGALYAEGQVSITDTIFSDNRSAVGGAVTVGRRSPVRVTGGAFTGNVAAEGAGGGLWVEGDLDVVGTVFAGNSAGTSGGGVYLGAELPSETSFDGATFLDNAATDGGGLAISGVEQVSLTNLRLRGNVARGAGGGLIATDYLALGASHVDACGNTAHRGAGASLSGEVARLEGAVFQAGVGAVSGGGIRVSGDVVVVQASFLGNGAPVGGGLSLLDASLTFGSSLVAWTSEGAGVSADADSAATSVFGWNDWHANAPADDDGSLAEDALADDYAVDPALVAYTGDCDDDLSLAAGSPLLDAGDPALLDADGSPPDIGATGGPYGLVFADADGDGASSRTDCDDADASRAPWLAEVAYDGVDQDCDGADEEDLDQDGWAGAEAGGPDCDDADADVHPGARDYPGDAVDGDCDGWSVADEDRDGWDAADQGGLDCEDGDPGMSPDQAEVWYDGVDQDCDGRSDDDADRDGHDAVEQGGDDCDDTDPAVHPGAREGAHDPVDRDCLPRVLPDPAEEASPPPRTPEPEGCACTTTPSLMGVAWALGVVAAMRRRTTRDAGG